MKYRHLLATITWFMLTCWPPATYATEELRLGFVGPLTGANRFLGIEVARGMTLGFTETNRRTLLPYPIKLITADNRYKADHSAALVRSLIHESQVAGFIGNVGTPSSLTILPLLKYYDVPLIAPVGATRILSSKQARSHIFSVRTDYEDEAFKLTQTLIQDFQIAPEKIVILLQKDAFGEAILTSIIRALKHYGLKDANKILQIRHSSNEQLVDDIAATILIGKHEPEAIFLATSYSISSALIEKLHELGLSPVYATFSFTGLEPIQKASAAASATVLTTQVTPPLMLKKLAVLEGYFELRQILDIETAASQLEFEGYLMAQYLTTFLIKNFPTTPPNHKQLLQQLQATKPFDLDFKQTLLFSDPILQYRSLLWQQIIYAGKLLPYKPSERSIRYNYKYQGGMLP